MLKSRKKEDWELMRIRQKNMQNWTEDDYLFYEDFFGDIEDEDSSMLQKPISDKAIEEGWGNFKQFMDKHASSNT